MQLPAEHIRRLSTILPAIAASAAEPAVAAVTGRVAYIGKPFPQWTDIRRCLIDRNFDVRESADARELFSGEALERASLVIVGESDGPRDAHEICAEIRRLLQGVPILLLTSSADTVGRILGLEYGADAWAAADADARGSVAQIRALLRRGNVAATTARPDAESTTLRAGEFVMNSASREVAVGRQPVELTTLEFALLWNLLKHAGQVMSRGRLAQLIGYDAAMLEGRAIDTLVGRLRHRLDPIHARKIRSIRAVGYMLCTDTLFQPSGDVSSATH